MQKSFGIGAIIGWIVGKFIRLIATSIKCFVDIFSENKKCKK